MARKLAITFSGAVSLGSYEAGVLYEVLYAIGWHNRQLGVGEQDKIYIDVLTGASAGGLSVALAAQKLLYEGNTLDDPYDNPLFKAWVTDIDLDGLLQFQTDEPSDCSILSSDRIQTLAEEYLLSRYGEGAPPPIQAHPSIGPDRQILLGLALSNLNGVDYSRPTLSGVPFVYTRFQDEFRVMLNPATDNIDSWKPIQKAAVSCGAFPFAFRAQDLSRIQADYPNLNKPDIFWGEKPSRSFTYTDGGLFQNQPLGLAKDLVDSIDRHQNSDCRAYLFVSPDAKTSAADSKFNGSSATFKNMAGRLVGAILNQARFQDWIEAETVNHRIDLFNNRAEHLYQLVLDGALSVAAMKSIAEPLLDRFFGSDRIALAAAEAQLQQQFQIEYKKLTDAKGKEAADTWIDAILVFELAADIHFKDEMYIYTVTANDTELAGSGLMAFLGFFDQDYRRHDYDVGRTKAREFLTTVGSKPNSPLPVIAYKSPPIDPPVDPKLTSLQIKDAPLAKRKALRDRLKNRANVLLKEADLPVIFREPLELFYLDRKIDEFLGL